MGLPAIRNIDVHLCPAHGPEKIGAVAEMDITVNGEAALHVGHCFTCGGQPTQVATGSVTVRFRGELAARALDDSGHGGKLVIGSANVVIGGPRGMGSFGAGRKSCEAMAGGRTSGKPSQSYGNCMPESLRQLIHATAGHGVTEDEVMARALAQGAHPNPGQRNHGALSGPGAVRVLNDFGVAAELIPPETTHGAPTIGDIKQAISARKGVVVTFDTGGIWPFEGASATHAALITGVELDDQGNVVAVFMNDTGLGECGRRVPADKLAAGMNALTGYHPLVVTKAAVW